MMNKESEMITCKACKGEGGFDIDKYHNGIDRHYTRFEECSLCEGSGELVKDSYGELEAEEGVVTHEDLSGALAFNLACSIGLFANGEAVGGIRRKQGGDQ